MDDTFDLFDLLEIDDPIVKEKKETPKKAAKKDATKKAPKTPVKKVETLSLPATVMVDAGQIVTIEKDGENTTKTLEEVVTYVCEVTGYPKDIVSSKKVAEDKAVVILNRSRAVAKGDITIKPTLKAKVGAEEISLASLEGEKKTVAEVETYIREQLGLSIPLSLIPSGDTVYCLPGKHQAFSVDLPVTIKAMTGEDVVLTEADFQSEGTETEDEDKKDVILDDVKEKLFVAEYASWKEYLTLYHCEDEKGKDTNSVMVIGAKPLSYVPEPTKPVMYPTNATISLIFARIELAPDMFGGKEEVTDKEIIAFLQKDYPEFTEERTRLTYEKKDNYIFPTLKSSTKGAILYPDKTSAMKEAEGKEYFLCNFTDEDGDVYRMEKTKVSLTVASDKEDGFYEYYLPKIPKQLIVSVIGFFRKVAQQYNTEALVWIFYDEEQQQYDVVVPQQDVTYTSVFSEEEAVNTYSRYKVADIHSHGTIPAFFSGQDNWDEKGNLIYGVVGGFGGMERMGLRAGTGGNYVHIGLDDICDDGECDRCEERLFELFERKAEFV